MNFRKSFIYTNIFPVVLFFTLSINSGFVFGQTCSLTKGTMQYEKELVHSALVTVSIPEADVKSAFNDFVEETFNTNLKGYGFLARKDEVSTEFEEMPLLAAQAIKLVGVFRTEDQETRLHLMARWEDGSFVHPDQDADTYGRLQQTGIDFLKSFAPEYFADQVDEAREAQEDLREKVNDTRKDLSDDQEEIKALEAEMRELKQAVKEKESLLQAQEATLQERRASLREAESALDRVRTALAKMDVT